MCAKIQAQVVEGEVEVVQELAHVVHVVHHQNIVREVHVLAAVRNQDHLLALAVAPLNKRSVLTVKRIYSNVNGTFLFVNRVVLKSI